MALTLQQRNGRRTAERRSEWLDRAAYDLDGLDRELLSSLAHRTRLSNGQRWLEGLTPDRARELFGEWIEENADERWQFRAARSTVASRTLARQQAEYFARQVANRAARDVEPVDASYDWLDDCAEPEPEPLPELEPLLDSEPLPAPRRPMAACKPVRRALTTARSNPHRGPVRASTPVVVGYYRVSTAMQAASGLGQADQKRAIEAYAAGLDLPLELRSDVESGGHTDRTGLEAAIEAARQNRAAILVVPKLDRLTRDAAQNAALVAEFGARLVALDVAGVDFGSPAGEFTANLLGAAARFERRRGSERTQAAMAQLRREGKRFSRYEPAENDAALVAKVLELRAAGRSLRAISAEIESLGFVSPNTGRAWSVKAILSMLKGA